MANFNEAREIRVADHLPAVLRDIREMRAIAEAEQPGVEALWKAVENCLDDQFLCSATEHGIATRESMLKIVPFTSDTLEDRRFRLQTRYNENIPYTRPRLRQLLSSLCGADGYEIDFRTAACSIHVKVALVVKKQAGEVEDLLDRLLPADMFFTVTLKYNQHQTLAAFTHGHLARYTHEQLRSEVVT